MKKPAYSQEAKKHPYGTAIFFFLITTALYIWFCTLNNEENRRPSAKESVNLLFLNICTVYRWLW